MPEILREHDCRLVFAFLNGRGWSRSAIAAATGLSENRVRAVLQGKQRITSYEVLKRIADGLAIERGLLGLAYTTQPENKNKQSKPIDISEPSNAERTKRQQERGLPDEVIGETGAATQPEAGYTIIRRYGGFPPISDIDAHAATKFVRQIASNAVNPLILEQLNADIRRLARQYVSVPLFDLFLDIRALRSDVFNMIENNRYPNQLRDLHLAASRLCGLQAHVCLDLGHYAQADTLARTAWLSADLADHPGMRGWVRGLQSLISFWDGRLIDAVGLAADGATHAHDGSISVRLPALQARAAAALGDQRTALVALAAAEHARDQRRTDDETGGIFVFPDAKQAVYAGTALLATGDPELATQAMSHSQHAITLYESAAPADRSSGDLLAAHLDLATAHLTNNDLDATHYHLNTVLTTPVVRRTASIRTRATQLGDRLATPRYRNCTLARQIRHAINAFSTSIPALPADNDDPIHPTRDNQ